jgi:molybdenum cofactor biosynthesis protein B
MSQTPAEKVRVLTVTISDQRKRHVDETGKRLDAELTMAGFDVVRHVVLADEPVFIRELVRSAATDNEADAVVLSGGTGITPRDQTFEALDALYEKKIEGFGEAFRRIAFDAMGPRAMFFRASAGIFNQCPVFSLPGNAEAVAMAVQQLIVPTLVHAVAMATGRETRTVGAPSGKTDRPAVVAEVKVSVKPDGGDGGGAASS